MSFAFFRKYNKIILAVGGSLLMVIFLIPQAASSLMRQQADQTVGRIGDREITINELRAATNEMQAITMLNRQTAMTLPQGDDSNLLWLLMIEEARQQGLASSSAQARQILDAWQVTDEQILQIKNRFKATDAFVFQALRHWQMVMQLQRLVAGPLRVSEPAMRVFARDVQTNVSVDVVPISAERLLDQVDEPTDAELQDRFNQNANNLPGQSQPFGFGYRLPNRVKLDYIAVPYEAVQKTVIVSEVEANRYYLEHPDEFTPTVEGALPDVKVEPKPYREVREKIIADLSDRKTLQKQNEIVKTIQAELAETTRLYERDGDSGYLQVGQLADLEAIAQQVQRDYGVLPEVVRIEDRWIPVSKIGDLDDFGQSFLFIGSGANMRSVSVAQYIALIRELVPANMAERNPLLSLRLQEGVPSQPVEDIAGNRYLFRVLDTELSQPPLSLEIVRDDVARDVKLLKAYGMLKRNAEQYVASASEKGLDDFAGTLGEEVKVEKIESFSRRNVYQQQDPTPQVPFLPVVGRSEQFVDAVFDLVKPIEQAGSLDAVPEAQRIGAVPVDAQLTIYITKITAYQPVASEEFAYMRPIYSQVIEQQDLAILRDPKVNPFTYEALATRAGYTPAQDDRPAKDDESTDTNTAGE